MFCFCIFGWKENGASTEVDVLYLDFDKFTNTTTKLINHLNHQLVAVIVNTVEKNLVFIDREITDNFTKAFIPLRAFPFSNWNVRVRVIFMVALHSNVKSEGVIKVSDSATKMRA